jgi:hypothetical protein
MTGINGVSEAWSLVPTEVILLIWQGALSGMCPCVGSIISMHPTYLHSQKAREVPARRAV